MSLRITRRDLLKLSGLGSILVMLNWDKVVRAAVDVVRKGQVNIVWFHGQACDGNTIALLDGTEPDIVEVLIGSSHIVGPGVIGLPYHETVMPEGGEDALHILRNAIDGKYDPFVLVLEGSIPIDEELGGPPGSDLTCYIGEMDGKVITCAKWIRELMKRAVALVGVGNCASYGGIPANNVVDKEFFKKYGFDLYEKWAAKGWSASPTGSVGFFDDPLRGHKGFIRLVPEGEPFRRFVDKECVPTKPGEPNCRPAIAVPGCPSNGNAQLRVLANLVLWAFGLLPLPELDMYWRPKYIFGHTTHQQCPRAAWYAAGQFRSYPGEASAKCLYSVGCKGPASYCPWNKVGWVNGVGGPTRTGAVCIACTMPGFTDAWEPFYEQLPYVGISKETLKKTLIALGAATAATGAALGAWSYLRKGSPGGSSEKSSQEGASQDVGGVS